MIRVISRIWFYILLCRSEFECRPRSILGFDSMSYLYILFIYNTNSDRENYPIRDNFLIQIPQQENFIGMKYEYKAYSYSHYDMNSSKQAWQCKLNRKHMSFYFDCAQLNKLVYNISNHMSPSFESNILWTVLQNLPFFFFKACPYNFYNVLLSSTSSLLSIVTTKLSLQHIQLT